MSRVALDLGFIQIYWYSLFIFLGILAAISVCYLEIKKKKIDQAFFFNMVFYGIIFAFIGARLYYVGFNMDYYLQNPIEILEVWNGGLAIHGGIFAAGLFIFFYCKKHKQKTLKIMDILVVGLILGQAIGRWGNFFNQEAFGQITTEASLIAAKVPRFIIDQMYINGAYRQPTFLYESIWNLFGFVALLMIRKYKYLKNGQLTGVYLMWYSAGRCIIESFRSDSLMLGPFKIAQIVSIVLFVVGLFLFFFCKRGSRFTNLYREEEQNEIRF